MYYKKLAQEYMREAEALRIYIKKLKKQYGRPLTPEDKDDYYRVSELYKMYLDIKHTGEYLTRKSEVNQGW